MHTVCHALWTNTTQSYVLQLKDAVIHGTASDTEFTILETLKLILMEVIQATDDRVEVVKERAAAAAERAAASEERRVAAAERQAMCTSLDRVWSVLTKTPMGGLNSDQFGLPVQQNKQLQQAESVQLAVIASVDQNQSQDIKNIQKEEAAESFAVDLDTVVGNSNVETNYSRTADSLASKAVEVAVTKHSSVCSVCQCNHDDDIASVYKNTAVRPSFADNYGAAQFEISGVLMRDKQAHTYTHTSNFLFSNFISSETENGTMVDLESNFHDASAQLTAWRSNQASSFSQQLLF
jgi:hypothetical protein